MKKHTAFLTSLEACPEAVVFADQHRSLKAAWLACQRPDWMLWLLGEVGYDDQQALRLFACRCVRETPLADGRKVWDLLADPRSRAAVEVAERFAVGEATAAELEAAKTTAWAATGDAWAAAEAAWAATGDAWAAAEAAGDATGDATGAAAWAATGAAWNAAWNARAIGAAATRAAAGDAWDAGAMQAQFLRETVPWSIVAELIEETQK